MNGTVINQKSTDLYALAFGTAVAMWGIGYICRIPSIMAPGWLVLALMLICFVLGGYMLGLKTNRGATGGICLGVLTSILNLLILGSLLSGDEPNHVHPSAFIWVPGSFVIAVILTSIGASIGTKKRQADAPEPYWLYALSLVAMIATFLLVVAGGLVTSHDAGLAVVDWPNSFGYNMFLYPLSRMTGGIYYEHAHRLLGSLVGLTTLVLTMQMFRVESRSWLKKFSLAAFIAVCIQGILGGLRVTGTFTMSASPDDTAPNLALAAVHGVLGQIIFAMMVAIVLFTSSTWRSDHQPTPKISADTDRILNGILVISVVIQIVIGALQRHFASGLLVHITMAVVVLVLVFACATRAWGLHVEQPLLPRVGKALLIIIGVQIILGFGALGVTAHADQRPSPTALEVIITTLHQVTGAVLLVFSMKLWLLSFRLLKPREPIAS